MRADQGGNHEMGAIAGSFEEAGSFGLDVHGEEFVRTKKLVPMQIFMPRKQAVSMDEIRIRRMKKGQDLSRSQLVSEALELLIKAESSSKSPVRSV